MRRIFDDLILLLLLGLFLLFVGYIGLQAYRNGAILYERFWASRTWGFVNGKIKDLKVDGGCGRKGQLFYFDLQYEYKVGVNTYINYSIFHEPENCYSQAKVDQLKRQFPIGRTVLVHADLKRPLNAVLINELGNNSIIFSFLINFAMFFGILSPIFFGWRKLKTDTKRPQSLTEQLLRRNEIDRSIRVPFKR